MNKNNTLEENIRFLLKAYKRQLEDIKKDDNYSEANGDKDTVIWDMENVIIELETALELSKDIKGE